MKTNVYKLVLGVFITLISFSASAQDYEYIPLVKPGLKVWIVDERNYDNNNYRFTKIAMTDNDTTIDDIVYKKLYDFSENEFDTTFYRNAYSGIREDSLKRVYFRNFSQNQEYLLYDFSLSKGDTFSMYSYYNCNNYQDYVFQIYDIDTIVYEGIPRRLLKIGYAFEDTLAPTYPNYLCFWIEGIGNIEGLLFSSCGHITSVHIYGSLRCYIHNGTLLYHKYSNGINDCITPIMGIEDVLHDNSITLYPNPSNREINISSENIINSVEIFNSLGQRLYQEKINSNEKTIDISSFVNGVYILGVNTENGFIRKKVIKN